MDNETTVRMFWTGDTPTVPKGWYEVTLKKRVRNKKFFWDNDPTHFCVPISNLNKADRGTVTNLNGRKMTFPIEKFCSSLD
tara:strand:- start:10165 stop:10407 length:243 start_codon:yes stop_codon:yes gene_type:complete